MNYADEAAKYFALEKQEQIAFTWRNEHLLRRAVKILDARMRVYPQSFRADYELHLAELHRDLCREDLVRVEILGNQQHYLRLAQAYTMNAAVLGHEPTGAVHAN